MILKKTKDNQNKNRFIYAENKILIYAYNKIRRRINPH